MRRYAARTIPDTNTHTHNCAAVRDLEEKIRAAEAAVSNRKPPVQPAKRRSRRDSSGSSSAQEPMVGIFWFFNGKLILNTTLLSRAEWDVDALTHPKGYPRCWVALQAAGSIPLGIECDDIARGRVTYDTTHDQFLLFRDRCIPMRTMRQIVSKVYLPKCRTVTALVPHYRCPRCMKKGEGS